VLPLASTSSSPRLRLSRDPPLYRTGLLARSGYVLRNPFDSFIRKPHKRPDSSVLSSDPAAHDLSLGPYNHNNQAAACSSGHKAVPTLGSVRLPVGKRRLVAPWAWSRGSNSA
jgi:hypothetical protein